MGWRAKVLGQVAISATVAALMIILPVFAVAKEAQPSLGEEYAQCVIARAPDFAERGLRENWSSDLFVPLLPRRYWSACNRNGVNPNDPELRYALAWGILVRNNLANRAVDFAEVPPLQTEPSPIKGPALLALVPKGGEAQFQAEQKAKKDRERILAVAGECVVRARSEDTRALLLDPENRAKLDALIPALQSCTPANTQITFTADTLRGLLAWIYVRLALSVQRNSDAH